MQVEVVDHGPGSQCHLKIGDWALEADCGPVGGLARVHCVIRPERVRIERFGSAGPNRVYDQFAANTGTSIGIGSGGNGFFANPCTNSNQPFSPVEAAMGSNSTFTNVCYSSTDLASPEPAEPCQ